MAIASNNHFANSIRLKIQSVSHLFRSMLVQCALIFVWCSYLLASSFQLVDALNAHDSTYEWNGSERKIQLWQAIRWSSTIDWTESGIILENKR